MGELQQQLQSLRQRFDVLQFEVQTLDRSIQSAESEQFTLADRHRNINREVVMLSERVTGLERDEQNAQRAIDERSRQQQLDESKLAELQQRLSDLDAQIDTERQRLAGPLLQELRCTLSDLLQDDQQLLSDVEKRQRRRGQLEDAIQLVEQDLRREVSRLAVEQAAQGQDAEVQKLQQKLDAELRNETDLKAQVAAEKKSVERAQRQVEAAQSESQDRKSQYTSEFADLNLLRAQRSQLDQQAQSKQASIEKLMVERQLLQKQSLVEGITLQFDRRDAVEAERRRRVLLRQLQTASPSGGGQAMEDESDEEEKKSRRRRRGGRPSAAESQQQQAAQSAAQASEEHTAERKALIDEDRRILVTDLGGDRPMVCEGLLVSCITQYNLRPFSGCRRTSSSCIRLPSSLSD